MFHDILVPLDGSDAAEVAIPPAVAMARAHGARLHLVLVTEFARTDATFDELLEAEHQTYHDQRMKPMADRLQLELGTAVRPARLVGTGAVAVALAEYAGKAGVDLVVMTTHGRTGLRRAWVGSIADDLMHLVAAPLLLFRRHGQDTESPLGLFWRILVALDGSETAKAALDPIVALDVHRKATVILGRVVAPVPLEISQAPGVVLTDADATQAMVDEATRYLDGIAAELRAGPGLQVETVVELEPTGFPFLPTASTIAALALRMRADLVALTTHERGASRILVGSVADRILRDTGCALLICHGVKLEAERGVGMETAVAVPAG